MGQSNSVEGITKDMLEEYKELTYLTRAEILKYVKELFIILQYKMRNKLAICTLSRYILHLKAINLIHINHSESSNKNNTICFSLYKIFLKFGEEQMRNDFHHRFSVGVIKEHFPQLKVLQNYNIS